MLIVTILLVITSCVSTKASVFITSHRCLNGSGTIMSTANSTKLIATTEFPQCDVDVCAMYFRNYCHHAGICVPPKDCLRSFPLVVSCRCLPPYTGPTCDELETQPAAPSFSFNNIICDTYANECKHGEVKCTVGETPDLLTSECQCCPGWKGELCDLPCSRDCGPYGSCYIDFNNNQTEICNCWENYTGRVCEIPIVTTTVKPHIEIPVWAKVIPSVLIVLFILMLLIVPYCMYKKRVELVMNIAYYFRRYEDDDSKDIDAFVSYCSEGADEQFVVHKLRPKLEQEHNFKLCLHFRDFLPGERIVDNITHFIERSRRSILIISPRYLESAYCRMEYQQAHEHMIRLKQKIIPVILEDIDDTEIDKHLSLVLKTVTYEKWPGSEDVKKEEKFWRKIILSMPKKKPKRNDNNLTNFA